MNGNGAYEGEMNDVVRFENALRAAVQATPDPAIGTALVPRLAETARTATLEAETRGARRTTRAPRSRLALVARVGIAVALIPLALSGLAVAGVTVPGAARDAFRAVGIALPNQPAVHTSASSGGHGTTPARANATSGSTTKSTSKGKSGAAHQHALQQHAKAKGKAVGHQKGKAIGLNGSTPPGQARSTGPPSNSNAGGNSANHSSSPQKSSTSASGGKGGGAANGHASGHSKGHNN